MNVQRAPFQFPGYETLVVFVAVIISVVIVINDRNSVAINTVEPDHAPSMSAEEAVARRPTDELIALPRTATVCRELLRRDGLSNEILTAALIRQSTLTAQTRAAALMQLLVTVDDTSPEALIRNLPRLCSSLATDERTVLTPHLEEICLQSSDESTVRTSWAMLMTLQDDCREAFQLTNANPSRWVGLLNALPLLPNSRLQTNAYKHLRKLLPLSSVEPSPTNSLREVTDIAIDISVQLVGQERQKAADFVRLIRLRRHHLTAYAALAVLPVNSWPTGEINNLAAETLACLAGHSATAVATPEFHGVVSVARSVADRLPLEDQPRFRIRLQELHDRSR